MKAKNQDSKESSKESRESKDHRFSDTIKRVASLGLGAAFMTEEMVKSALSDVSLPKELIQGLTQNGKKMKEEFVQSIQSELAKYLKGVNPTAIIDHILNHYHIELQTKLVVTKKERPSEKAHTKASTKTSAKASENADEKANENEQ